MFTPILVQDAAPYLQKGSAVVFISSIGAYQPSAGMTMYGVTKTALLGLTKVRSWDLCFWLVLLLESTLHRP